MLYNNYTISLYNLINYYYSREEIESWFSDYNLTDYITTEQAEVIENYGVWKKEKLAKQIVEHYLMEEIAYETPALFRHYVKCKMNEIMESKLPLIYSMSIEYDPLVNVDFTETFKRDIGREGKNEGASKSNSTNDASGLSIFSDTPQGQISKEAILEGNYARNTTANEATTAIDDTTTTNATTTENTAETYSKKVKGNSGVSATAQKMIVQYRDNIRAVNLEIIKELQNCFMSIY